jgi:hypothetical protein
MKNKWVAAALMASLSWPGWADEESSGPYLGLGAGFAHMKTDDKTQAGLALNAFAGYRYEYIAAELGYLDGILSKETTGGGSSEAEVRGVTAGLVFTSDPIRGLGMKVLGKVGYSRLTPYFVVKSSDGKTRSTENGDTNGAVFFGVGMEFPLSERWGWSVDYTSYAAGNDTGRMGLLAVKTKRHF